MTSRKRQLGEGSRFHSKRSIKLLTTGASLAPASIGHVSSDPTGVADDWRSFTCYNRDCSTRSS
jgi:hypothetical protein